MVFHGRYRFSRMRLISVIDRLDHHRGLRVDRVGKETVC